MDKKANTENKTEQILNKLNVDAVSISKKETTNASKKLNENIAVSLAIDEFKTDFLKSANIKSFKADLENNTISLLCYNSFIMSIMADIYKADFNGIKSKCNTRELMVSFNRMVSAEVKNNTKPFLNSLNL